MRLFVAGGCGEHGRNSFLLEDDRINALVDCGIIEGTNPFPKLSKGQINKIRYLFLTHSHKDHSGGVEWLISNGFQGSIITTEETRKQCKINYDNWIILPVSEQMPHLKQIDSMICVKYGRSGHCVGSIWLLLEWNHKKILFTGDYKEKSPVYICDKIRNITADLAVVDCAYGNNTIDYAKSVDSILKSIHNTIISGSTVLMPIPQFGRGVELLQILKQSGISLPVYMDTNCQENEIWMKTEIISTKPFKMWKGEPAVLLISDPQLRRGENYEVATAIYKKKWFDFIDRSCIC